MSIIGTMNIAQSALNVNQTALTVVSNNIANMNTEGYLKHRVNQVELEGYHPYASSSGFAVYKGGGVGISSISQYANQLLANNINDQTSNLEELNNMLSAANDLADILNELGDGGLSTAFTEFYSAAQQLTTNPSDSVLRINYVNAAQNVADAFNRISSAITDAQTQLVGDINNPQSINSSEAALQVEQINQQLQELAELNHLINTSSGTSAGTTDIVSKKNEILNELSSLVGFTSTENSNGTVNVQIGGVTVLRGSEQVAQLQIVQGDADNPVSLQLVSTETGKAIAKDVEDSISGGSLGGILQATSATADGMTFQKVLNSINLLAKNFAESVNEIQTYNDGNTASMAIGLNANGEKILVPSTENLFELADGATEFSAATIKINQKVFDNPNLVAAARVEIDQDGNPLDEFAVGNTGALTEIIGLQNANFGELDGVTMAGYLKNLVTRVGLNAENLQGKVDAQADVLEQAQTKYTSEGGVDLNEELMDMIKYQRAFEAASRIFSACSEMFSVLVSLGA